MVSGIIVAAGSGSRLGAGQNKVLLPLGGEALFCHAVRSLREQCDFLVMAVKKDEQPLFEAALHQAALWVDAFVQGGQERRHSVENALQALPETCDIVLVHDAARPFASQQLVGAVIAAARQSGAAVPALPVADSLRTWGADGRSQAVPREGLYRVQTPQGFRKQVLLSAYAANPEATTDDAGLVELLGRQIALVPGESINFKVTTKEDWVMAERLALGDRSD